MSRRRGRIPRNQPSNPGPRVLAVRILGKRFDSGVPLEVQFLGRPFLSLSSQDQSLCRQVVDGVLRNLSLIDAGLRQVTARPLGRVDSVIRWLLRATVYQIRFLRVPDYAAVSEAVRLCPALNRSHSRSFVNGVLRGYLRTLPEPPEGNGAEALAVRFSHPQWLVSRMLDRHGLERTRAILDADNSFPPSIVWVNPEKTTIEKFCRQLEADEIVYQILGSSPNSVRLEARGFVRHSLYRSGHCFFMDAASQRVAWLADLTTGSKVVADLCAAPGGKSFLTASRLSCSDTLVCCDVSYHRLREMRERAELLGISNVALVQADSASSIPLAPNCDLAIADVPCSGLGTIRSNPDLRWFVEEADLERFQLRQIQILTRAFSIVKPGGEVVYSTCSTEPEENELVVEKLLQSEPRATLVGGYFRNLPGEAYGDGFFAARIRRR